MEKRWTALLLALCLTLAAAAPVLAEGDAAGARGGDDGAQTETAQPERLAFDELDTRIRAGYYPMLALEESVRSIEEIDYDQLAENLRLQLNDLASVQWTMIRLHMTQTDEYRQLTAAYDAMCEQYDAIRRGEMQKNNADVLRQLKNAQDQIVVFGETLYITLKGLESQDAALARTVAQLERSVEELKLRRDLGQVPALSVEQAAAGRARAVSGRATLQMNYDACLLQLQNMIGAPLGGKLTLAALPHVTAAELAAMDVDADLARAMEASYDLLAAKNDYQDVLDNNWDLGENAKTFEQKQAHHTVVAARCNYEDKLRAFEVNFRTLHMQVLDCAQILAAAQELYRSQQKVFEAAELKYSQGSISANALADAKDELAAARAAVTDAERELFAKYRSYRWAADRGILNG